MFSSVAVLQKTKEICVYIYVWRVTRKTKHKEIVFYLSRMIGRVRMALKEVSTNWLTLHTVIKISIAKFL